MSEKDKKPLKPLERASSAKLLAMEEGTETPDLTKEQNIAEQIKEEKNKLEELRLMKQSDIERQKFTQEEKKKTRRGTK